MTPKEEIIRHVKKPHLAQAVSLTALSAIRTCFSSSTADGTLKKTRATDCVPTQTQQRKTEAIEKEVTFSRNMTKYDVPPGRVCTITSSERFLRNQPVVHSVVVLRAKVLTYESICAARYGGILLRLKSCGISGGKTRGVDPYERRETRVYRLFGKLLFFEGHGT